MTETAPVPYEEAMATAEYVAELLWTDTRVYKVVGRTARTLRLQLTRRGEIARKENRDGNPYPCVWHYEDDDPEGPTRVVRLRKDGTYRVGTYALRPCQMIDGRPVSYTDYRY